MKEYSVTVWITVEAKGWEDAEARVIQALSTGEGRDFVAFEVVRGETLSADGDDEG